MSLSNTEKHVKDIRRKTRRKFSSEEKIRIVLDGLRGEYSIAELCRREGINNNLYYRWSKDFLEAGKRRLSGDTVREASTDEVIDLKKENASLKQAVAELYFRNDWLKKSLTGQDTYKLRYCLKRLLAIDIPCPYVQPVSVVLICMASLLME